MKQIVAFGASSSKKSINKDLATYAASLIEDANVLILDLNDFEMPIYSIDYENDHGIPEKAYKFKEKLKNADGIIISFAEHNSVYTAAFKNIFDWISRIEKVIWYNKPMFLLSTSDGDRGAKTVLQIAYNRISHGNPYKIPTFSLPNFSKNFDKHKGIINHDLNDEFQDAFKVFISNL
jgi:chromate reductase